jgi:radical SAM protein with 4Fe4S-binding SPASM domain
MNKRRLKKAIKRIAGLPKDKYLLKYITNKAKHIFYNITRSTKVAYPATIMLELNNYCNLACTTCPREYGFGKEMDKGMIGIDQAKKVIDELWPYLDSIGLTGMGETFLYKDIEQIVDYIKLKNKGIIISVSTNAVLPNFIPAVTKLINKIDTIQISVDGLGEVYESIRKKASFHKLDENLRQMVHMCRGTSTELMLNMVVTKENYYHMPLLVKYAGEIGIRYLDFTLYNLVSITEVERSYYEFYKSDEFLNILSELEDTIRNTTNVTVTNRNFKTDNGFRKCPFPWTHFYICWNGFVTPCCAKPFPKELNFGNVFNNKVIDILNSNEYREFRSGWYNNRAPEFCNKCHFIDIEPIQ